jgi:hypothetical protein
MTFNNALVTCNACDAALVHDGCNAGYCGECCGEFKYGELYRFALTASELGDRPCALRREL